MKLQNRALTLALSAGILVLAVTGCSDPKSEVHIVADNFESVYNSISSDTLKQHTKILSLTHIHI